MEMTAPPGKAVWRRGLAGMPTAHWHPSMETIRTSLQWPNTPQRPPSRRAVAGCVLSPARQPPRPHSKQTLFATSTSQSSYSSCSSGPTVAANCSASSLSPSCRAAGFGLGSSRGATDYMPFAFAADAEFFKEVVRSERRASNRADQQRQFGRVASSQVHVGLAAAFPTPPPRATAGTIGPLASLGPPARHRHGSVGKVFQR